MLNVSVGWYFSSRAIAAAGNLLAVAIFTRIAGPAEYGEYLIIFAWSLIVFGFGTQWMAMAYFGVYQTRRLDEYVASLGALTFAAIAVIGVILAGLAFAGFFRPVFLLALFALVCGTTVHVAAYEVTRTLQNARAAAQSIALRTVLVIAFGSAALLLGGGAASLAFAIAIAHLIAAWPSIRTFTNVRLSQRSRDAAAHLLRYGWPLLLSFGVMAIGQTIDRLLLAHYFSATELGYYGVVGDVIRQSFVVCGEAIALSFVTIAKQHTNDGDPAASDRALQKAFHACLTASAFGVAFFLAFGEHIVGLLFGAGYVAPAQELIPIFAVAFAFILMRNFYFAQVIYFTHASYLELIVSTLFVIVSAGMSLLLIPTYGSQGAALSLMTASVVGCIAFALIGRRYYRMPINLTAMLEIPLIAAVFVFGAYATNRYTAGAGGLLTLAIEFLVFALLGAVVVYRYRLLRTVPPSRPGAFKPAPNQVPAE
jgi:O-antigen/teichoic acid export membrane protein